MKGLLIGDYQELFSKEQFIDLATRFGFKDIDQSYSALNELYTFYGMYLKDNDELSRKGVKTAYRAISGYSKKLAQSLDIPLFESALLHFNTDITTYYSAGELKELLEAVERLVESDKLPPTTPVNKGKVLQFPYNGNMESSRKVAK